MTENQASSYIVRRLPSSSILHRMQSPESDIVIITEPEPHPLFSSKDGDVTLVAEGGRWFRTMFSLPQNISAPPSKNTIYMDEDDVTLEHLLRMICGLPILPIESYDVVDAILYAAEKYDMPGPLSIIRLLLVTPPLLDQPFRLYAAACRFGWEAEAKFASTQTLAYNLHAPEQRPMIQKLSTDALLNLFELHRQRREGLRKRLDDPPFVAGGVATCVSCNTRIDYHTWRELKYKIILEMDVRPLGDTIVDYGLTEWPEAKACWEAKCPNARIDCDRALYDKSQTVRVIKECIDGLPKCI